MKIRAIAIASMLTLIAASTAYAGDIYKWVDAEGNVHYGDRPNGEQPERLNIVSQSTDRESVQAAAQARVDARTAEAEEKAAAAAELPSAEDLRNEAKQRAEKCATYKTQMQQLVTSRRLYREDENGERVYLDDSEALAARERVEKQISEFCSS